MVAAGKDEIRKWFVNGVEQGYEYMLIVYDRMEYPENSDSVYYAYSAELARDIAQSFRYDKMCEVTEVYDLKADMESQLAEKRAWHLPTGSASDGPDTFSAFELLASGETRLAFMERKNEEYTKEYFGTCENVSANPVRVFSDELNENIHAVSVYILEQENTTIATVAAVYHFTPDGGAAAYASRLMMADEEIEGAVLIPLPQYHSVDVDEPYITFDLCYADRKDPYSPAYQNWSLCETVILSDKYPDLGSDSCSAGSYVDKESHKLYERAMEILNHKDGIYAEAMDLLHRAAGGGHGDAMFEFGNCYSAVRDSGIAMDAKKAAHWYKMAALLGREVGNPSKIT